MKTQMDIVELNSIGLKQMKALNEEYLAKKKGSEKVRKFLTKASKDDDLLLIYLKGRKYRPQHAWETLKRKAEVRLDEYPEVFRNGIPPSFTYFISKGVFGVLKQRDPHGRRILICQGCHWDPDEFSILDVTQTNVHMMETLNHDEDALNNGIIYIQNCKEMGWKHASEYSLPAMLRLLHVFWAANPLRVKGVYFINVPYYLHFIYGMIKPFLTKKLKQRLIFSCKGYDAVHANINPEILPKFLGGPLDVCEALEDISFF